MCQCLCCQCWWINACGIMCGGLHHACCLASCWMCKQGDLLQINADCCLCCQCTGWGFNECCWGNVICAPQYVRTWSRIRSGGVQVVVINKQGFL